MRFFLLALLVAAANAKSVVGSNILIQSDTASMKSAAKAAGVPFIQGIQNNIKVKNGACLKVDLSNHFQELNGLPMVFEAEGLPTSLQMSPDGVISGCTDEVGVSNVLVKASSMHESVLPVFQLAVTDVDGSLPVISKPVDFARTSRRSYSEANSYSLDCMAIGSMGNQIVNIGEPMSLDLNDVWSGEGAACWSIGSSACVDDGTGECVIDDTVFPKGIVFNSKSGILSGIPVFSQRYSISPAVHGGGSNCSLSPFWLIVAGNDGSLPAEKKVGSAANYAPIPNNCV